VSSQNSQRKDSDLLLGTENSKRRAIVGGFKNLIGFSVGIASKATDITKRTATYNMEKIKNAT
jgi:hypothetical protein